MSEIIPISCQKNVVGEFITYLLVKTQNKNILYSCGDSKNGLIGQGAEVETSNKFRPLHYDYQSIQFVKVAVPYKFGMALTDKGELYVWGENQNDQFGLEQKFIYSPTKIALFDDYTVVDFSCGEQHALVQARHKTNQCKTEMFLLDDKSKMGDIGEEQKVKLLKEFSNKEIEFFVASRY
jgi:alpha-tubulin suppressor-like RCC1 family protein